MIIDLDAHQGNGYERDCKDNPNIYIMDVYNKWIYPRDNEAKKAIRRKVQLDFYTEDDEYLSLVNRLVHLILKRINLHYIFSDNVFLD